MLKGVAEVLPLFALNPFEVRSVTLRVEDDGKLMSGIWSFMQLAECLADMLVDWPVSLLALTEAVSTGGALLTRF